MKSPAGIKTIPGGGEGGGVSVGGTGVGVGGMDIGVSVGGTGVSGAVGVLVGVPVGVDSTCVGVGGMGVKVGVAVGGKGVSNSQAEIKSTASGTNHAPKAMSTAITPAIAPTFSHFADSFMVQSPEQKQLYCQIVTIYR